ncbi:RICIN domain-containing protein [Streptomyces sp. NPDC008343]|uniref:RICIN domain-containing protein n=1 Tax=Streptomyces sp. NPDC008343 TaxID=3364828 RepID=UPI0036EBF1ED
MHGFVSRVMRVMALASLFCLISAAPSLGAGPAAGATEAAANESSLPGPVGPWVPTGNSSTNALWQGQGLATVIKADGSRSTWFTGLASVPLWLRIAGWGHVGDPDSHAGYVVEPYQAESGNSKMFRVWTPDKSTSEHYHALVPGEARDNNFAAVSPDGQWIVSGQWGPITTLPYYPMPFLNADAPGAGHDLPLAGMIRLDRPIGNIQGCDFTSATQLVCSSDSATSPGGLTKPLVQIDLQTALGGTGAIGHVTELGPLPLVSICSGTFEAEGLDYDSTTGDLRVQVVAPMPCAAVGTVWHFKRATAPRPGGTYLLADAATGYVVDSPGFSGASGTPLVTWQPNFGSNQQWKIVDSGSDGGYHQLRLVSNGLCMDVEGASTARGAPVLQYACDPNAKNQANQLWRLIPRPDGKYLIESRGSGQFLTAKGEGEGSALVQAPADGAASAWWLLPVR